MFKRDGEYLYKFNMETIFCKYFLLMRYIVFSEFVLHDAIQTYISMGSLIFKGFEEQHVPGKKES